MSIGNTAENGAARAAQPARWYSELEVEGAPESFGAEGNLTGEPIGGGEGYSDVVTQGDYIVYNLLELNEALCQAREGQVIFLPEGVEINLDGQPTISIPGGVTLASTRGRQGSAGALIVASRQSDQVMIRMAEELARITGLRIEGPFKGRERINRYRDGVSIRSFGCEIDNCEIWGFGHAATAVGMGATRVNIHHNHIHHNRRDGLGYGVTVDAGDALIEANMFDWGRHFIASTGSPGSGYEARYNKCGPNCTSHLFDMHGGSDRGDGTDIAGDWLHIHHNTFMADMRAVSIRGVPCQGARIHHNWFYYPNYQIAVRTSGRTQVYQNIYGSERIYIGMQDELGDPLPAGALARLGTRRMRGEYIDIAYVQDGRRAVAISKKELLLWDLQRGELQGEYAISPAPLVTLAVSKDRQRVLIGDAEGTVVEWDLKELCAINRICSGRKSLLTVQYSPDEERIMTLDAATFTLEEWDRGTGALLNCFTITGETLHGCLYAPDGLSVFVGHGPSENVLHYDLASGQRLRTFANDYTNYNMCISPDGTRLLVGTRHQASEWDLTSFTPLLIVQGHSGYAVPSVAYCPDSRFFLTGSRDGSIRLWDRSSQEVVRRWFPHRAIVKQMCVSPDGTHVLSYGGDGLLAETNLETGAPRLPWERHLGIVQAVTMNPDDGCVVSGSEDGTIRKWASDAWTSLGILASLDSEVHALSVSPDGERIAVGAMDGSVRELSMRNGAVISTLGKHSGYVRGVAYYANGEGLLSVGDDGSLQLWSFLHDRVVRKMNAHQGGILALTVLPDGLHAFTGGRDGTVRMWEPSTGHLLQVGMAHRGWVEALACDSSGGRILSAGDDGLVIEWSVPDMQELRRIRHEVGIKAVCYAAGGTQIVSADKNGAIRIWDRNTGQCIRQLFGHEGSVNALVVAAAESRLISASADSVLLVWELPSSTI